MSQPSTEETLSGALRAYIDARGAALLVARKSLGIGELDARALLFIVDHPGARPRELGDYLGITSAGVTTLTDRLVERGVVRRNSDETDRRVVRLTSTVDLGVEPWSALNGFDVAVLTAIGAGDPDAMERAAVIIRELTEAGGR